MEGGARQIEQEAKVLIILEFSPGKPRWKEGQEKKKAWKPSCKELIFLFQPDKAILSFNWRVGSSTFLGELMGGLMEASENSLNGRDTGAERL